MHCLVGDVLLRAQPGAQRATSTARDFLMMANARPMHGIQSDLAAALLLLREFFKMFNTVLKMQTKIWDR